ncbi:Peptidyl-prolyl cis-trans isomerase-like 4 [Bifiguratus adelaidae]|uniref:Peptidyl-prolyl cis-trans isomerase n=1 Tax=Bifiguratus adelaidae TaxID=1938954 RepID=A0A261Y6Y4_9FUNG|nr:Peptidyl-prolyl cis-trans isomerase-like 4 [Bifiguratus adelaidae]
MSVLLETSLGDIVIDLHTEACPRTTVNFLKLCKIKYYNYCLFHNVQKDFMAQTGDPTGTGSGGESVFGVMHGPKERYFEAEINAKLKHTKIGTVSMANAASDATAAGAISGSQFFITLGENLDYLDGKSTVFGEVAEGFDVLEKLNEVFSDEQGRPYKDVRIRHTVILDDPFPDPPDLQVPDQSPPPPQDILHSTRIGEDEDLEDPDVDPEELERRRRAREAKAQALTLEMVGDLPFAEVKPPENVLFVCKLNPVTRDEDLELIFSQFGKINSCEVIRDRKTGDSLGYAFIEFDDQKSCEQAYFKMQSVLIDDRRIHVDFSQSVSKLHKDWISKRVSRGQRSDFGGEGLVRKTRYRDDKSDPAGSEYSLVFDHGGSVANGRDRPSPKDGGSIRDRSFRTRDSLDRRRERSPYRDRDDRDDRHDRRRRDSRERHYRRDEDRRARRSGRSLPS